MKLRRDAVVCDVSIAAQLILVYTAAGMTLVCTAARLILVSTAAGLTMVCTAVKLILISAATVLLAWSGQCTLI